MDYHISSAIALRYAAYFVVGYYVLLYCHRLLSHPLRKYPGPVLARLSDLYGAWYAFRTNLHLRTWQDHVRYGPTIRHGPNKLVFSSVEALQDIYQSDHVTKSQSHLVSQRAPGATGLFNTLDKSAHQKKRKLLGPVVNDRSIRAFEPTMLQQIDIFLRQLSLSCRGKDPSPVNMTERLEYLTMDIMGHFVFGYPLKLQTESTFRFMTDKTPNFYLNIALQLPYFGNLHIPGFQYLRSLIRYLVRGNSYRQTLKSMIRSRLNESEKAKHNLFFMTDSLRISEDDDTFIEEIRSEATFLISAGSDTMSTCISALLFYLARYPDSYCRLAHEVRHTFRHASEIRNGPQLSGCQYLRACIDESLRLAPPIPGTLWREQAPESSLGHQGLVVDGHRVPRGTQMGVNLYSLHHNEAFFSEPFAFRPERWLADCPAAYKSTRAAFAPFSLGPRACMGKFMAYLEASLVVAKILWYFDFEQAPCQIDRPPSALAGIGAKVDDEYQIRDLFGAEHDGPWLRFHPRQDILDNAADEMSWG